MGETITFLGAAETVTGSQHLIEVDQKRILIDCGLFQGNRELRERNWKPFAYQPHQLDAVVITHAHLDHIGMLPRLVKEGYRGPIYATPATIELARISLPDSGRIQEEDAYHANKHGTRHTPALPLYTEQDAFGALRHFQTLGLNIRKELPGNASFRFLSAGHILGSAFAEITLPSGRIVLMSGDLGRYGQPIIVDPVPIDLADVLVVESTYGDRLHAVEAVEEKLEAILAGAWRSGGVVLIPSFAIGRTQEILYFITKLQTEGRIPRIPVYVDSPMATSVTSVYGRHKEELDEEMLQAFAKHENPLEPEGLKFVRDRNASKALNSSGGPMVIIAGSGMCNGGRIVHHLLRRLSDESTTVLFSGYQGVGTLGREILDGAPIVHIFGSEIPVRAKIESFGSLSAHADQGEIMRWLGNFKRAPRETYIVHGEPEAQAALREKISKELSWNVLIPKQGQSFSLD